MYARKHFGQPKNDGVLIDWQCSSAVEHFACVLLHSAAAWQLCSCVYVQLIVSKRLPPKAKVRAFRTSAPALRCRNC